MRGTLHAFSKASSTLLTALLWLLLAFACSVGHVGAAQVQAANSREPKVERGMPELICRAAPRWKLSNALYTSATPGAP